MIQKKINDLIWEIDIVSSVSPELIANGEACLGSTWPMSQEIYLADDLNKNTARRVIAHELTHAFIYSTQIKEDESYTEEELCEFVSKWGDKIFTMTDEVYNELYCEDN
jgi:hypothetical protein